MGWACSNHWYASDVHTMLAHACVKLNLSCMHVYHYVRDMGVLQCMCFRLCYCCYLMAFCACVARMRVALKTISKFVANAVQFSYRMTSNAERSSTPAPSELSENLLKVENSMCRMLLSGRSSSLYTTRTASCTITKIRTHQVQ